MYLGSYIDKITESVLSVLVESFTFSLTDREIHWCKGDIRFPTMKKEDNPKPCMLLKIERYQ